MMVCHLMMQHVIQNDIVLYAEFQKTTMLIFKGENYIVMSHTDVIVVTNTVARRTNKA